MFCPNCGTNLPDGTKFCSNCGSTLSQPAPAQNPQPAQNQQPAASPYAPNYQQPQQPAQQAYQQPQQAYQQPQQQNYYQQPKKPVNKKLIAIIASAAVVVIAIAVVLIIVLGGGSGSGYEDVAVDFLEAYFKLYIDEIDKYSVCNFNKLFPDYDEDELEEYLESAPKNPTFDILETEDFDEDEIEELNELLDEYRDDVGKKYFKSGEIEDAVKIEFVMKYKGGSNNQRMLMVKIDGKWYVADEDALGAIYTILDYAS